MRFQANMKKLKNYLDKNGITYNADIMGGDYFRNADGLHIEVIQITVWYGATDYYKQRRNYEKVEKYAARYGYKIVNSWFTGVYNTMILATNQDAAALALYLEYETASVNECEKLAHVYYTGNAPGINLNGEMGHIMDKYGLLYNTAKIEEKTA